MILGVFRDVEGDGGKQADFIRQRRSQTYELGKQVGRVTRGLVGECTNDSGTPRFVGICRRVTPLPLVIHCTLTSGCK